MASMLSPVKLYKQDMQTQRKPVTWGPKGKPKAGCSGTACYRHKNVDWTVHRLAPAIVDRDIRKHGKMTAPSKVIGKFANKSGGGYEGKRSPRSLLLNTSPRWGPGEAPSRHTRKLVPLPKPGHADVSTGTKAAIGVAAVAGAGYYGYKHREQIKQRTQQITSHFHNSHMVHTMRKAA